MVYKKSMTKRSVRRTAKAFPRRRTGRSYSKSTGSRSLDKVVEAKVKRALSLVKRGPARSVYVTAKPCRVNREMDPPEFVNMAANEWQAHLAGPLSERKYALFPVTELVPAQRSAQAHADNGQRTFDKVLIKGVCVRMTVVHSEGVRIMLFAFRNGTRRDLPPNTVTRPFVIEENSNEVAQAVKYELLTKDELYYDGAEGPIATRHLGLDEGPFGVRPTMGGEKVWKSADGTAFTSRMSTQEGRPIGTVSVKMDGSRQKKCGKVCNMSLNTSGVMRTVGASGKGGIGGAFTATRFRTLEFFVEIGQPEAYINSSSSRTVNERPIELFLGFDAPQPFEVNPQGSTACASITSMDMEVYYE